MVVVHLPDHFPTALPEAPESLSYSEFLGELRSGKLSEVQITERALIGFAKTNPRMLRQPLNGPSKRLVCLVWMNHCF